MSNGLVKYNTVYSSKLVRKESKIKTTFKIIFIWTLPIAYFIHYRDKKKENENTINALQGEIERLELVIESQAEIRRKQQSKPELVAEQTRRLIKYGNNVRLEENNTYDGNYMFLNEFLKNGGW
jgi:hypothetical protein